MELQLGLGLPSNGGSYELDLNRQFHENGESFDRGHSDGQRRRGGKMRQGRARAADAVEYCDRTGESECGDGDGSGWGRSSTSRSNYVKVTMEGMGIGRKVDLSVHCSYESLIETLIDMFGLRYARSCGTRAFTSSNVTDLNIGTSVLQRPNATDMCDQSVNCFRLVYQDNEGDWLCAEDEPWGSFVESALRLKLIKMDRWD